MQTIYTTTPNITSHTGNIVDLADYRRRLALDGEGSLAPQPQALDFPSCWAGGEEEETAPVLREESHRRSHRRERRALLLDGLASVGVLVMTLSFTLRILMV